MEPQTVEPQIVELQTVELQIVEPQIVEPQIAEPQIAEPQIVDPQIVELIMGYSTSAFLNFFKTFSFEVSLFAIVANTRPWAPDSLSSFISALTLMDLSDWRMSFREFEIVL